MALYRCIGNGGGVTPTDITPSNASPATLSADGVYHATAAGYAIASYNSVTPSNSSPVALTSGDVDKMGGAGYAIESYSDITPSNSLPATISSGSIYKASANGKAVESVLNLTPTVNGAPIVNGSIYKATRDGYAVRDAPDTFYNNEAYVSSAASSFNIDMTGYEAGKVFLVLLFYAAGSATSYTRLDGASCSNGTIRKVGNLRNSNATVYGTFYEVKADNSGDDIIINAPYSCFCQSYIMV